MQILFSDACCTLMVPEMAISNPATQVQRLYFGMTTSNQIIASISHIVHEGLLKFLMLENRANSRVLSTAQNLGSNNSCRG
jgi:hypothetical protein